MGGKRGGVEKEGQGEKRREKEREGEKRRERMSDLKGENW